MDEKSKLKVVVTFPPQLFQPGRQVLTCRASLTPPSERFSPQQDLLVYVYFNLGNPVKLFESKEIATNSADRKFV